MVANFSWGRALAARAATDRPRGTLLAAGITANLAVLGYYKYANFFVANLNAALGAGWVLEKVILPLAISFFTFQQIAYLVDCARGLAREGSFPTYTLFVSFFPHLIAGPIVHHQEMMPQFARPEVTRLRWDNLALGATQFTFGLAKKVLLADPLGTQAVPVFQAAARGEALPCAAAWLGVLAYTLQIYFDFSGYTDMALGLGRLFNIVLPQNFNSPYQAVNLVEFWRRWHMTLSRFLRDYLYIPLGGNRHGRLRRHVNLMITMFLGGLWHGAGWTFVLWGVVHGVGLVINHAWLEAKPRLAGLALVPGAVRVATARTLTFAAVVAAWVLFRSENFHAALRMYAALGHAGWTTTAALGEPVPTPSAGWWVWLGTLYLWVWFAPNSQDVLSRWQPALGVKVVSCHPGLLGGRLLWAPTAAWAALVAVVFAACFLSLSNASEFLYYKF
jgi:D-alanyl-lipoteichoic acid acyltransferase DltB (MBOAT superfamily)